MIPDPALPPFEELYAEHWRYVLHLLPDYGIPPDDHDDVAQQVWTTVHLRQGSYNPDLHKTPRAWLTGIVRRCSANHRRTERRRLEVPAEDAGAMATARGLDPEQAALLRTIEQSIRDDGRREAFLLQQRHGLSIAEIATVQGVSADSVEWRLHMAKEDLKDDDREKKSRAFLGFGTLEALSEALRPKPIPFERGAKLWERIQERIRYQGGASPDGAGPSSSVPPAAAVVPALAPLLPPAAVLTFTKAKLTALVVAAFLGGVTAGAGGILVWQAHDAGRPGREASAMEAHAMGEPPPVAALPPSGAPLTPASAAAQASSVASTGPAAHASPAAVTGSRWLLGRMRRAAKAGDLASVLALAEQHAEQFPQEDAETRERLRNEALTQLGQQRPRP